VHSFSCSRSYHCNVRNLLIFFQVETFLDFDKSSQGIVFTTDRAYQPGEQVTFFIDAFSSILGCQSVKFNYEDSVGNGDNYIRTICS
jgi:hypothetical protein